MGNDKEVFFSVNRQKLLAKLLKEKGISPSFPAPSPPIERSEPIPLSFSQQWMWYFDQLEASSPYYNMIGGVQITGDLDILILQRSLNAVIQRHEALRTTFVMQNKQPAQKIHSSLEICITVTDLEGVSPALQESELQRLAQQEASLSFDLSKGPLIRARVIKTGSKKHILLFCLHHIISDGWSNGILIKEWMLYYAAFLHNTAISLPQLPLQYADYALQQWKKQQDQSHEQDLAYWKKHLCGASNLTLPTTRSALEMPTLHGKWKSFSLPSLARKRLLTISQENGVTLFTTLLAVFQLFLHVYTQQDDLVIFSRFANRDRHELKNIIGCFFTMLLIRTNISEKQTFPDLLSEISATCREAYTHQNIPFNQIMEILRANDREAKITTVFAFNNFSSSEASLPELTITPLPYAVLDIISPFDLDLSIKDTGEILEGKIEYKSDLFDTEAIDEMIRIFQAFIEQITAHQNIHLMEIKGALKRRGKTMQNDALNMQ